MAGSVIPVVCYMCCKAALAKPPHSRLTKENSDLRLCYT